MSPIHACEWVIAEDNHSPSRVRVGLCLNAGEQDEVVVTWVCGERFYFTPEHAKNTLQHIRSLAPYPNVVLDLEDSREKKYTVRLDDDGSLVSDAYSTRVGFAELNKAVKTASKALKDFG